MDRPVECGHCQLPIQTIYKEIVSENVTCTGMCSECPVLERKLYGTNRQKGLLLADKGTELCCGQCQTTFEAVREGQSVGCMQCYEIFCDLIVEQLLQQDLMPPHVAISAKERRLASLHVPRAGQLQVDLPLSEKLSELSRSLNDALRKENYEQAAILRDQIKKLKEKKGEDAE